MRGAEGPKTDRRFGATLGIAALVHVVALVAMHRLRPAPARAPAEQLHFVELALLAPEVPEEHAVIPESVSESEASDPSRGMTARSASAHAASQAEASLAPETPLEGLAPEPSKPPSASSAAAPLSLAALGLGGENPFLGLRSGLSTAPLPDAPPPPDPHETPDRTRAAEKRLDRSLLTGMLEHDRAVGASRAGPLVTALRDAAMQGASPVNGSAEFVATIDSSGAVVSLYPVRVSSSAEAFRTLAAQALRSVAKKRLRVPAGTGGLVVRLALSSRIELPSGARSGAPVALEHVPLVGEDGKLSRLEAPRELNQMPDATGAGVPGVPAVRQGVPVGPGGRGDLADVGAVSRRVVHVSIVDERPL
jgi:hypothetical protein